MAVVSFLAYPLGAALTDLLWGTERFHGLMRDSAVDLLRLCVYVACFVALPLIGYALIALWVARAFQPRPFLDAALRTGNIAFPLLALAAQVFCWKDLGTDSQAGLMFLFVPQYAGVAAAVLVVGVFLVGWIANAARSVRV